MKTIHTDSGGMVGIGTHWQALSQQSWLVNQTSFIRTQQWLVLTMVNLVLFLVHGVDASSGPELQQSLEQQSTQVYYRNEVSKLAVGKYTVFFPLIWNGSDILHFGSDPSELENPASFADTQAAKQSLSSNVIVSIYSVRRRAMRLLTSRQQLMDNKFLCFQVWTHPSFQIYREPVWHIDHLEALFNLFVKFHFPQVFPLASLKVKQPIKWEQSSPPS